MNFRGFPPGCGDSVDDFWGWDAHEARLTLSRWCVWWYAGRWNTRRGLKPKSTNYPDHGHHGNLSLQGKIPMVEPGIEPGTSWLIVRDPDHLPMRLVTCNLLHTKNRSYPEDEGSMCLQNTTRLYGAETQNPPQDTSFNQNPPMAPNKG